MRLFQKLLPIRHSLTPDAAARYRVEPYVLAAGVYGAPPHIGRGGWTWYTGAAGWAYRCVLEVILGIRPEPGGWRVDPCIPKTWPGFEVTLRDGTTTYRIQVENPHAVNRGVQNIALDGKTLPEPVLPRVRDGRAHDVVVGLRPAGDCGRSEPCNRAI